MRRVLVLLLISACFSPAQTSPKPTESGTGIEGVILVGPIHGGPMRLGVPSSKPLANTAFVVATGKGVIAEFTTDDQGKFRVSLAPAHYAVSLKEKKGGIGGFGPFETDVVSGQITKVEWQCDTGMR